MMVTIGRSRVVAVGIAAVLVAAAAVWWRTSMIPPRAGVDEQPPVNAALNHTVQGAVPAAESAPTPFVDIEGTHLAGADDAGRRLWELQAESLQIDQGRNTIGLTGVTGWLYRGGTRQVRLAAPRATYLTSSRAVELSGGVAGEALDGRTFSADRVRWAVGESFTAIGHIVVTQHGVSVRADQMRADAAMEAVTFEGHVAITLIP